MTQLHNDDKWVGRLSEYIDGDLTADERSALERHVETCSECSAVLEGLHNVVGVLRTEAKTRVAPALPDTMWPAIVRQLPVSPTRVEPIEPRQSPWPLRVLIGALLFLLGVAAGVWYERARLSGNFNWHIPQFMRAIESPVTPSARVSFHSPTVSDHDDN